MGTGTGLERLGQELEQDQKNGGRGEDREDRTGPNRPGQHRKCRERTDGHGRKGETQNYWGHMERKGTRIRNKRTESKDGVRTKKTRAIYKGQGQNHRDND